MVDFSLNGKVAVVTGAGAGGIGEAYARALGQAGASVAIADINGEAVAETGRRLSALGLKVLTVETDIASPDSVKAMAAAVEKEFGGIDILVNNAAIMAGIPRTPLVEFDLEWWDRVMRVNVRGALVCAQACVPSMVARGGGKIVNQVSMGAFYNWGLYGISKLALVGLTYGLAKELGKQNINVNAIAPGVISSAAGLSLVPPGSPFMASREATTAMNPLGTPDDLCGALLYLVSPAGKYMTGQCLNVDGGAIFRL